MKAANAIPMKCLFFPVVLWVAMVVPCVASGPTVIVENGQARATIVLPADAGPAVREAARQLSCYVERMSGAKVPIVTDGGAVAGTRIDVGPTAAARNRLPEGFEGDTERIWIEAGTEGVTVCGGGERGTLFAAYRFLEALGCRWLAPEPENELVPVRKTISLGPIRLDARPAFSWRLFSAGKSERERWGLKMGMNGFYSADTAATNGACIYWPRGIQGVHAYYQIVPAKRYFAGHPEWGALLGGKRVPTDVHRGQLCVTAPGLADEFAANVIRALDLSPDAPMVSVSPNDGSAWCECDACLALDRKLCGGRTTEQGLARAKPFVGDRVFWFANEVADRVALKHPDKKLLVLAYINYAEPPDTIRPRPSVVPFLCHYAPADYSRAIGDPASGANRQFDDLLKRWLKISPDLMIYSYVSKSMWWRLPRPVLHTFAADVKYLHGLGVRRYYCQSSLSDWPLDGPLYYVIAKLLWDPSGDPDAIAREWEEGMFGVAAPAMREFYAAVETAVRKTGKSYSDDPRTQGAGLYERASLDRAMAAIDRAEIGARGDGAVARRVAEVARTFRYGYWMIECLEQHAKMMETGDPARMEDAREAGRKALGYCEVREAADFLKSWKTGARLGVMNNGFGKEELKGDRRCWNSDETGPGDNACGWATFTIPVSNRSQALVVEMDVWGESRLTGISVNTRKGVWTPLRPRQPLSRKPQWDTLQFRVPSEALDRDRVAQQFGFGGADSQIWVAAIRAREDKIGAAKER